MAQKINQNRKTLKAQKTLTSRRSLMGLKPALYRLTLPLSFLTFNSLLELKTTVQNIEVSVQVMSDKYDAILADTTRHEADIKGIKKKVQALETKVYSEVDFLKEQLNDLEWRNRKLNLEFHGIEPAENENLIEKVNKVATLLNVAPLSCNDVAAIHRLKAKPGKTPGIIVRFSRNDVRDEWFAKRQA